MKQKDEGDKCRAVGCHRFGAFSWAVLCDEHAVKATDWASAGEQVVKAECRRLGIRTPQSLYRVAHMPWLEQAVRSLSADGTIPVAYDPLPRKWPGRGPKAIAKWEDFVRQMEPLGVLKFGGDAATLMEFQQRPEVQSLLGAIESRLRAIEEMLRTVVGQAMGRDGVAAEGTNGKL